MSSLKRNKYSKVAQNELRFDIKSGEENRKALGALAMKKHKERKDVKMVLTTTQAWIKIIKATMAQCKPHLDKQMQVGRKRKAEQSEADDDNAILDSIMGSL